MSIFSDKNFRKRYGQTLKSKGPLKALYSPSSNDKTNGKEPSSNEVFTPIDLSKDSKPSKDSQSPSEKDSTSQYNSESERAKADLKAAREERKIKNESERDKDKASRKYRRAVKIREKL